MRWKSISPWVTSPSHAPFSRARASSSRESPCASGVAGRYRHRAPPRIYWDVRFSLDNAVSFADATAELNERLRESVRLRMIAEVPLGAFLSGGVDSSAVVATMAGLTDEPVNTCSRRASQHVLDRVRRSCLQ